MSGSYNAGSIEANLRLDRSEFNRDLQQAKKDAEEFAKQKYTPKIELDDTEAKAKITALKEELRSLRDISVTASLSGYADLSAQLTSLQAQADHLNHTAITVRAQVDDTAALATLASLDAAITAMSARTLTIHADVDTRNAAASIAAIRAAAAAPITIRTATGPNPRVSPARRGGGDPTPDPDPDAPRVPDLGDGDTDDDDDTSRRRVRKIKDPLNLHLGSLMSLPGLIASVLPQLPALTNLLGGATAAAASFGVAAGGAMGIYAGATMGAVKQAVAHKKAVDQTQIALEKAQERLAGTTAGTEAYKKALKDVTEAEKAHKKAIDDLTPAEKKFNNSLEQTKGAWQSFIGATSKYTLAPVTTVIQGAALALPKFIPLIKEMAPVIQDVADGLKNWMSGDGLTRFVTFLRTYGIPIVRNTILAFRGFATAGGALVRAFGPVAEKMSGYFKTLGDRASAWGKNGGAERFRERFMQSWHQLKPIFLGLITTVKHIWDILDGTGTSNGHAIADVLDTINLAISNLKPAAVKALGEIFQSISDVAIELAPVIGITSKAIVDIVNALPPGTIRLIADAMIAWKLAIIGWNAAVAVWGFLVTVIEAVETAWIALTIAWGLSPIGVIVTAIVALIAVVVVIATKTTWFQTIWSYTWAAIKTASLWVWNNALKPMFQGIWTGLQEVGKWGMWLWTHALKPAWEATAAGALWLWHTIKPALVFIGDAFVFLAKIWWTVYSTIFKVVFILLEAAVKALWLFVLKPVFGWIMAGWHALGAGFRWVYNHLLKPAWEAFASAAVTTYNHTLGPVFGWIGDGFKAMGNGFRWVYNHIIKPAWDAVAGAAKALWTQYIKPIFQGIQDWIGEKWRAIKDNVFAPMKTFFTKTIPGWGTTMKKGLIDAFDSAWKGIQKVWDNVKKAIGTPIYWVAKYVWNDAIYAIMDKIASFVNTKNPLGRINTDKIPHFAQGGAVPHTPGSTPGKDSVNAVLMPDEHVFTREDVAAMGGHERVKAFRSALHGGRSVQGANSSGRFGLGGWIEDAGSSMKSAASKGLDALENAALGALAVVVDPVINKANSTIDKLVPGSGDWSNLAAGIMKKPLKEIKDFVHSEDKKVSFHARNGTIPTGQHLAVINAALKAAKVPPPGTLAAWQAGLNTLITRESGWNPKAINLTDSNAKAGHPSQGLAQTIPSTFNAYVPSSLRGRGITDPVANVAAAIRYIVATYGNISNVQQANASKAPKGYWTGTDGAAPGLAWVGERGPELVNFHGGETVYNNRDSLRMASMGSLHGYASGTRHQRAVVRDAYEERDKDRARRDAAEKKYDAAHKKYLNATTAKEQAAAKREMAKYDKQIDKANKEIAADNKLIKLNEKRYKAASKAVEQERKDAATLAAAKKKARDAEMAKERKAAQDYIAGKKAAIDAKIQVATDARTGYYDAAVQTGQLSGLTGNRAAGFTQQLQAKIKAIKDFQVNLHTLAKLGLSPALIQQVAAMGPEQGGQLAQSLARTSSAGDLKKLNAEYKELEKVSGKYADSAADDGFGLSTLKKQSKALGSAKITVTAPHTIMVSIDGKKFKAHTEKVVEEKVTEIVAAAGKKK